MSIPTFVALEYVYLCRLLLFGAMLIIDFKESFEFKG